MATPLELHKERKKELSSLYTRMDSDATALQDPTYSLTDKDGKAVRNVLSMCSNRLQMFAAYVEASLGRALETLVVESNNKAVDTGKIEEIANAAWAQIAQKRRKQGRWPINSVLDQFNCRRGSSAMEVAINKVEDENGERLDIIATPWDPRWSTFIMGENEPEQAGREIEMTRDEIESQPLAKAKNFTLSSAKAIQTDIITKDKRLFYIDDKEAFGEDNPYGFVSVAWQEVPVGSMLQDKDIAKYRGESILYVVRDLVDEYNRQLSILNTKSNESITPPMQIEDEGDIEMDGNTYTKVTGQGSLTQVKKQNAIHPVLMPDLRESVIALLNEIKEMLNDSTLKQIALTDIPSGGVSTATLLSILQGQGQIYMPRLGSRGMIKETVTEYIFKMIKALKLTSFTTGSSGNSKTYPIKVLDGQYDISYIYTNASAESTSAQIALAQTYKKLELMPDKIIMKDVLKRDDWEGEYNALLWEKMAKRVPMIGIYREMMAGSFLYKERGDDSILAELKIAEQYLGITAEQMKRGILPQMGNEKPIQVSDNLPALESPQRQALDAKNALATEEINAG
ncbi:hypothetical protein [Shewanella sp.]|uniref:hypothetical protein n=1 Tax=Shewanella sp. TaxID=50422 RepID=UPI0035652725